MYVIAFPVFSYGLKTQYLEKFLKEQERAATQLSIIRTSTGF